MHARPCIYCIVFLITIFFTSQYWAPVPISHFDTSLLQSLGTDNYGTALTTYLPSLVPLLDRCWISFTTGSGLFQHSNVSQWEEESLRAAIEESRSKIGAGSAQYETIDLNSSKKKLTASTTVSNMTEVEGASEAILRSWYAMIDVFKSPNYLARMAWARFNSQNETSVIGATSVSTAAQPQKLQDTLTEEESVMEILERENSPLEWDLRKYGIGMVIDFGLPKYQQS